MKKSISLLFTALLIYACSSPQNEEETSQSDTLQAAMPVPEEPAVIEPVRVEPEFHIRVEEVDYHPISYLSVLYDGKVAFLDSMDGTAEQISKERYQSMEIPQNALAAYGGWWAGLGTYYYLIPTEEKVMIFKAYEDEGSSEAGLYWSTFMELTR
ncbi:hypothetical protein [Jiulongibacter sediminis]|jgi:hypothetical protein|uniref:hypothetical protein n=1 Tax=Jiulongibacter sediminis TaxID=1605367 RepID=UPI0026EBE1C2|nr:hypothetical protein [Jiulongibacter sediminis]